jgi:hypothetical protein
MRILGIKPKKKNVSKIVAATLLSKLPIHEN